MNINIITANDLNYEYSLNNVELIEVNNSIFKIRSHLRNSLYDDFKDTVEQFQKIYFDLLNKSIKQVEIITDTGTFTYPIDTDVFFIFECMNYPKSSSGHAISALILGRK